VYLFPKLCLEGRLSAALASEIHAQSEPFPGLVTVVHPANLRHCNEIHPLLVTSLWENNQSNTLAVPQLCAQLSGGVVFHAVAVTDLTTSPGHITDLCVALLLTSQLSLPRAATAIPAQSHCKLPLTFPLV